MAILDTFYLLFKSDASALDKGLKESEKGAAALIEKVKGADVASLELGKKFLDVAKQGAAVLGVGVGFAALAKSITHTADEYTKLSKLAEQFRSTASAVDEFRDAGELLGLGEEQTIGGLKALDGAIQDTAMGLGRAKKIFEELGISVVDAQGKVRPTADVMGELATKFKDFDRGKQLRVMERLGLDPALLKLFNADMGALQKRMSAIDQSTGFDIDRAVARSKEYTTAQRGLKLEIASVTMWFSKLGENIKLAALPYFTKAVEWATKAVKIFFAFILDNESLVEGAFIAIAAAVTAILLPALIRAGVAMAVAAWPFVLAAVVIAALIAAFALLYDEITNFIEGNDSFIGQFLEEYPQIAEILRGIGEVLQWLYDTFASVLEIVIALGELGAEAIQKVWTTLVDFWHEVVDGAEESGKAVSELFAQFLEGHPILKRIVEGVLELGRIFGDTIGDMLKGVTDFIDVFGGIGGIAKSVGGAITGALADAKTRISIASLPPLGGPAGLAAGKAQLGIVSASPIGTQSAAATGARASTKNTHVTVGAVNVQTQATDAAGISKSIGDTMGAQLRQAASNYDDGVAA